MTAPDLTEAERAIVERFEQAPDALTEGTEVRAEALTVDQRAAVGASVRHAIDAACWSCGEAPFAVVARMVAEAADAREAEVRARVERRLRAGDGIAGIRAALAPADNDGEARNG